MPDEVIYRCIHAACARQLPRRVNFCPYCGTGQHAGVDKPTHVLVKPVPVAAPVAAAPPSPPPAAPRPPPAPPPQPARAGLAARPPQREPIKTRYWILGLLLLWGIWVTNKPASQRVDERIERAIAMSRECKSGEAQAELIALRSGKATPVQLQRLQQAINAEAVTCQRRSARNLVAEAQQAIRQGNYSAAVDKMEVCIAMVEGGSRECSALKTRAEKLLCNKDGDCP